VTDLIQQRLDAIPELKVALAELAAKRDQKSELLIRVGNTF
jgi:hypothetical protein